MRAHMCVAAGRWQCTAAHRLWRLECPRQQCWSLTCVLGPQQTAAVATAAACCCLIQSSQRCSEACRIRAVWYLLRLSAFRPGDRSWMVRWSSASSIEPSMAGRRSVRWRAERCTARPKKHGSDAMSQNVRSGSPRAGPSRHKNSAVGAPLTLTHSPHPLPLAEHIFLRASISAFSLPVIRPRRAPSLGV